MFEDDIPSVNTESKEKFFEIFTPVFERNARYVTSKNKEQVLYFILENTCDITGLLREGDIFNKIGRI